MIAQGLRTIAQRTRNDNIRMPSCKEPQCIRRSTRRAGLVSRASTPSRLGWFPCSRTRGRPWHTPQRPQEPPRNPDTSQTVSRSHHCMSRQAGNIRAIVPTSHIETSHIELLFPRLISRQKHPILNQPSSASPGGRRRRCADPRYPQSKQARRFQTSRNSSSTSAATNGHYTSASRNGH